MASLVSPEKVRELLNDGISSPDANSKRYVLLVLKQPLKMLIIAAVISHLAPLISYINVRQFLCFLKEANILCSVFVSDVLVARLKINILVWCLHV